MFVRHLELRAFEAGAGGGFEALEEGNFGKEVMRLAANLGIKGGIATGSNVIVAV